MAFIMQAMICLKNRMRTPLTHDNLESSDCPTLIEVRGVQNLDVTLSKTFSRFIICRVSKRAWSQLSGFIQFREAWQNLTAES